MMNGRIFRRLIREIISPSPHNYLFRAYIKIINRFIQQLLTPFRKKISSNVATAVYDLNYNPFTFDFAHFLVSAEIYFSERRFDSFRVLFIKKNYGNDGLENGSSRSDQWRFNEIIVPLLNNYATCDSYSIVGDDENVFDNIVGSENIFPRYYNRMYKPGINYNEVFKKINTKPFKGFKANAQALIYISKWVDQKLIDQPIVTITLREYEYDPRRNSNLPEWIRFARWVESVGYAVVFVPDTENSFVTADYENDFITFKEACWNLSLRVALYEKAFVNYVAWGPAQIAYLSKYINYITMNLVVDGSLWATRDKVLPVSRSLSKYFRSDNTYYEGFEYGASQFPFATNAQYLCWEKDDYDNIKKSFKDFLSNTSEIIGEE